MSSSSFRLQPNEDDDSMTLSSLSDDSAAESSDEKKNRPENTKERRVNFDPHGGHGRRSISPGSSDDDGDWATDEDEFNDEPVRKFKPKKCWVRIRARSRQRGQVVSIKMSRNVLRGRTAFKIREARITKKPSVVRAELADDAEPITYTGQAKNVYEQNVQRKAIEFDKTIHVLGYRKRNLVTRVRQSLAGHYRKKVRPHPISEDTPWAERVAGKSILKVRLAGSGRRSRSKSNSSGRKKSVSSQC